MSDARRWTNPYEQMEDEELLEFVMYGNRIDGEVDQAYETLKQRLLWRKRAEEKFIGAIIENKEYFEKTTKESIDCENYSYAAGAHERVQNLKFVIRHFYNTIWQHKNNS